MADKEIEIWENATRGRVGVRKFDARGDLTNELVKAGGKVTLTPQERVINQERAASEDLDVFRNGHLTPVKLIDGTEDAKEIASNPNLMGESDLRSLFEVRQWKTFEKKVGEITNSMTLERLLALADDDDTNATVKQLEVLQARLDAVNGVVVDEPEDTVGPRVGVVDDRELAGLKASTPR